MSQSNATSLHQSRWARTVLVLLAVTLYGAQRPVPAAATLPITPTPTLLRTLSTNPLPGSDLSARDHEGSAYVPRDNSLWISDDDGRSIYELNARTGALKSRIRGAQFAAIEAEGGGPPAGRARADDIQALAYDASRDILFAFSGTCCIPGLMPTAFRISRNAGSLQLESYQPLPDVQVAAAAWNPGDGSLYIGADSSLRSYDYMTNAVGNAFGIPGVSNIYGMDFTDEGTDLFIARTPTHVTRVDWASKSIVAGWDLDLAAFGVLDARAVEVVAEQLWVSDGYDFRAAGDPLSHALFVVGVGGSTAIPGTPGTPSNPGTPGGGSSGKNLIGNGGFERHLRGWAADGRGVTLTRTKGGHSGSHAGHLERARSRGTAGLTDAPNWVDKSRAGTYTASIWVRAARQGDVLELRLRETNRTKKLDQASARITLTKKWQKVTVALATSKPGKSTIDYSAMVKRGGRGTAFDADDARLTLSRQTQH